MSEFFHKEMSYLVQLKIQCDLWLCVVGNFYVLCLKGTFYAKIIPNYECYKTQSHDFELGCFLPSIYIVSSWFLQNYISSNNPNLFSCLHNSFPLMAVFGTNFPARTSGFYRFFSTQSIHPFLGLPFTCVSPIFLLNNPDNPFIVHSYHGFHDKYFSQPCSDSPCVLFTD